MNEWEVPFAETIDRAKKYVVSSTLSGVDWNAELVRGDLGQAVQRLKQEPGEGLWVGGVTLPLALADLGLIDEYEFLVQPVLAGHGPTLLAGLRERIQVSLWIAHEFRSGAVALRYRSAPVPAGRDLSSPRLASGDISERWPRRPLSRCSYKGGIGELGSLRIGTPYPARMRRKRGGASRGLSMPSTRSATTGGCEPCAG